MGRPANNVPYTIKGTYHIRFQGVKTPFSLQTASKAEAEKRANVLRKKRGLAAPAATKRKETAPQATKSVPKAVHVVGTPPTLPVGLPSDAAEGSGSLLDEWAGTESEFDLPNDVAVPPSDTPSDLPSYTPDELGTDTDSISPPPPSVVPWEESKPSGLLSPDEKSRVHGLLAGLVGRINILAVGYAVKIFGKRTPAEPDEQDTKLLDKAWALQLEEWLGDTEIEPKVLILAASAGLGLGMYMGGEPLPPKPLKAKDE